MKHRGWLNVRGMSIRIVCALLCAAALFVGVHRAAAQGTSGTLPEPISTDELSRYAAMLGLSAQQQQAAHAVHDDYKAEFRALREGEIDAFLKEMRSMDNQAMPKRKVLEDFVNRMDDLNQKIVNIDNRMLDALAPLLTPDQAGRLPRVKMARERARYRSQQIMFGMGGPVIDLAEMLIELKPSPADVALYDPLLGPYETKLTSSMRDMREGTLKMWLGIYDTLEAAGIDENAATDPEQMTKVMEVMQSAWQEQTRKITEKTAEIQDLNKRTQRTISSAVSPELGRSLRTTFITTAYPEANFGLEMMERQLALALKSSELTEEQRQAVSAALDEYRTKGDAITDKGVQASEDFRASQNPFDFSQENWQAHQERLGTLREEANTLMNGVITQLSALLGEEVAQRLSAGGEINGGSGTVMGSFVAAGGGGSVAVRAVEAQPAMDPDADQDEYSWGVDQFLPPAVSEWNLGEYATVLDLSDDDRAVLAELHKSYMERWAEIETKELAAVSSAIQNQWKLDEETQQYTPPTPEMIEHTYRLRATALEAIRRCDQTLWDDISTVITGEAKAAALERVKLMRDRQTFAKARGYGWGASGTEAMLDLTKLVRRLRLDADALKAVTPALVEYEKAFTAIQARRYERSIEFQKASEVWNAKIQAQQQAGEFNGANYMTEYQAVMKAPQDALRAIDEEANTLNREMTERLATTMPGDAGQRLRDSYNKKAFPEVYNDPFCANQKIDLAMGITDLTSEQRRMISDAAMNYRPEYDRLSKEMVTIQSKNNSQAMYGYDPDNWREWQERSELLERVRYDRNELNQRMFATLKTTLNEEQLQRIGGVPETNSSGQTVYYGAP